jgi:hypothetical protein
MRDLEIIPKVYFKFIKKKIRDKKEMIKGRIIFLIEIIKNIEGNLPFVLTKG